jgi:hypothetical protein
MLSRQARCGAGVVLVEDRPQQAFLAAEVMDDRRGGDAGVLGDRR